MVSIQVNSNVKEFKRSLNRFQKKQLPFATAGALTATAFDAQRAVKRNVERKFTLRNKFTLSGIRVQKANKRTLTAAVFFTPQTARYMLRQEHGATLRPSGNTLAVPMGIRRDFKSRITPAKRPRAILEKENTFRVVGHPVLADGIYRRMKSGRLKMLYGLETSIRIPPRLNFEKTVRGVVRNKLEKNLRRSLARAMETAR